MTDPLAAYLLRVVAVALVIAGAWRASRLVLHEPTDGRAYQGRRLRLADVNRRDSMLLWPLRFAARRLLGDYWSKPVLGCPLCMGVWWSAPAYWAAPVVPLPPWPPDLAAVGPAAAAAVLALAHWVAFGLAAGFLAHRLTYDLPD